MARVGYVTTSEAQGDAKAVMEQIEGRGGEILNLYRTIANAPGALRNFMRLGNSLLAHGALPPVLRELAILRVGSLTGATYEWAHHVPIAKQAGVTDAQLGDLDQWEASESFDGRQRAVIRYAEAVTTAVTVPDDVFSELRTHLSEGEVVELTLVAGFWGMVARILVGLQVDVEPAFERHLPA